MCVAVCLCVYITVCACEYVYVCCRVSRCVDSCACVVPVNICVCCHVPVCVHYCVCEYVLGASGIILFLVSCWILCPGSIAKLKKSVRI